MRRVLLLVAAVAAFGGAAHEGRSQPETRDPSAGFKIKMWDLCLSGQLYRHLKDRKGDADAIFAACREEEIAVLPEGTPEETRQEVRRAWLSRALEALKDRK